MYSQHLEQLDGGRRPIVDVKYNSWHQLNHVWQAPGESPYLMNILATLPKVVVLHVVRNDVLAQCVSDQVAAASGVWHYAGEKLQDESKVVIDPESLLLRMRQSVTQLSIVRSWLQDLNTVELHYEETYRLDGALTDFVFRHLSQHMDIEVDRPSANTVDRPKVRPLNRIANWEAIITALTESEFSYLADQIPREEAVA